MAYALDTDIGINFVNFVALRDGFDRAFWFTSATRNTFISNF